MRHAIIFFLLTALFNLSQTFSQQLVSTPPDTMVLIDELTEWFYTLSTGESEVSKNQQVIQYNDYGKISAITEYQSTNIPEPGLMIPRSKSTFSYDDKHSMTTELMEQWELDQWREYTKKEKNFDQNGRLVDLFVYHKSWDIPEGSVWRIMFNHKYIYNSQGDNIERTMTYWENDKWNDDLKWHYDYDSNRHCLKEEQWKWDSRNKEWVAGDYKTLRTYNDNGRLQTEVCFVNKNYQWIAGLKYEYTYINDTILTIINVFNLINGNWISQKRIRYTYNNNRIKETFLGTLHDNIWDDRLESTFEYDNNGYLTKETGFDSLTGAKRITITRTYAQLNSVNTKKTESVSQDFDISYSLSNNHCVINSLKLSHMKRYHLSVYNAQGKNVFRSVGIANNGSLKFHWDVNRFNSGLYLFKVAGLTNEILTTFHTSVVQHKK